MLTDVDMILGDFEFKVTTAIPVSMDRRAPQNKAELQRLGRKGASHHIGAKLGTIKLTGHILPHWNGGWGQMDALRAMGNEGAPYVLMDGLGNNLGLWEIMDVGERGTEYFNGAPSKINFDVSLREYGPDQDGFDLLSLAVSALVQLVGAR